MARIVVTGAGGFIGRHLLARLADRHEVWAVSRRTEAAQPGIVWVKADLGAADALDGLPSSVDAVVHLAQSNLYRTFPGGAADMLAVNVDATVRLLDYSVDAGARAFVLASSGNVQQGLPTGARPALTFYTASKAAAELLCLPYAALLRTVILRLWTPYGPGQKEKMIPVVIDRVRGGETVTLDGEDGLHFTPTHVDDVVNCLAAAALNEHWSGIVDVGGPATVSMRDLANMAGRLLAKPPLFTLTGRAPPPPLVPDLTRLRQLTDPQSFVGLEAGLRSVIAMPSGGLRTALS